MPSFVRMYRFARVACFPACAAILLSCRETPLMLEPQTEETRQDQVALECKANVAAGTISCVAPQMVVMHSGGGGELIVGGQNVYVRMLSDSIVVAGGKFSFRARLQNLIRQPMNTTDGASAEAGITIFFHTQPVAQPTGTVTVDNADGFNTFTAANQPFFFYTPEVIDPNDGILQQSEITAGKTWTLAFTPDVQTFTFTVLISAPVQYPDGWVDINPDPVPPLLVGNSVALTDSVLDALGQYQSSDPVTWSSDADSIATVDSAGVVQGVSPGTATITASSAAGRTGSVQVTVTTSVDAPDHDYEALGNVARVRAAPGLLTGATVGASVVAGSNPTVAGGVLDAASDGSFTYISAPGFAGGRDSAQYIVTNGVIQDTAWVKFTVTPAHVWYVQNNFAGTSDGTSVKPFKTLADAIAAAPAGDSILVFRGDGTATGHGAITLLDSHALLGEGMSTDLTATLDGSAVTYFDATGNAPLLGGRVTLATANTIAGVFIETDAEAAIFGNNYMTADIRETALRTTGAPVLNLTGGTGSVRLDSVFSTGSTGRGMLLRNVSGVVHLNDGSISGAEAAGIEVTGSAPDSMIFDVDITSPAAGRPARIDSLSGGVVIFSGNINAVGRGLLIEDNISGDIRFTGASKVFSTGANRAINMINNGSTTVSFVNGGLAITTTTADGINANRTGLRVGGDDNTITSTSGAALALRRVNLVGDVRFRSVNVSSAGTDCGCGGILLDRVTGDSALHVTGTGAAGSGGTVHGAFTVPIGINESTAPIRLHNMSLSADSAGGAVQATGFGLLDLDGSSISATNGAGAILALMGTFGGTLRSLSTDSLAGGSVILFELDGSLTIEDGSVEGSDVLFYIDCGTLDLSYGGDAIQNAPAPLLLISSGHSGTINFTGDLTANAGTGITVIDGDGTYNFAGSLTVNGDAAIDITDSNGTFTFNSSTTVTSVNPNFALGVTGGGPVVNFAGTITASDSARAVSVTGTSAGTINVSGAVVSTGGGITLTDNSTTSITFADSVVIDAADAVIALNIQTNPGTQISFSGGLRATSSDSITLRASGGGTLSITGDNNTLHADRAGAISLDGIDIHANGVKFRRIDADSGATGVSLVNTGSGPFTVTGVPGVPGSGGLVNDVNNAFDLANTGNISLNYLEIGIAFQYGIVMLSDGADSDLTIENSAFQQTGLAIRVTYNGDSGGNVTLRGNTITQSSSGGIHLLLGEGQPFTSDVNIDFDNNSIVSPDAVYVGVNGLGGMLTGTVRNNTIGSNSPASCDIGLQVYSSGDDSTALTIENNLLQSCVSPAMKLLSDNGAGAFAATVHGNTFLNNANGSFDALAGSVAKTFCIDLGGGGAQANTFTGGVNQIVITNSAGTTFSIADDPVATDAASIATHLSNNNNGASAAATGSFSGVTTCQ